MARIAIWLIECYQRYISILIGNHCRFIPSCSQYAKLAILKYGIMMGSFHILKRILRCHPFCLPGYDPLP
ncbi:membrane protein insertion efficiency factor YidD [bacterium]|nr:membrane protein insertion efficiency factor YidD [bacterium]MBU1153067.1 membrane protein insertion efficiency factor YidD [bacterium]MBU1782040.1 membrane protein insertion efficiency factor YidD [bacterium]MBU2599872.1 membrane protein insertion efficiency factor YidD [bacterium]